MITPDYARHLIEEISNFFQSNITVYLDENLLLNTDGKPSFCRVLTVDERNGLALDSNIEITSILYLVAYSSESPPDTSLSFSVSNDGGITLKPVNFIRYTPKIGQFEILLKGD
jgi:hypothetical protein